MSQRPNIFNGLHFFSQNNGSYLNKPHTSN
jgi:hypothetical protein